MCVQYLLQLLCDVTIFSPQNCDLSLKKIKHAQILSSSIGHIQSKSNEKLQHWPGEYRATKILLNFHWEDEIARNYELFEIVQPLRPF
jgi:hypothetical protein